MKNNYCKIHEQVRNKIEKSKNEFPRVQKIIHKEFSKFQKECKKSFKLIKNDLILIKKELKKINSEAIIFIGEDEEVGSYGITVFQITYNLEGKQNRIEIRICYGIGEGTFDDGVIYINFKDNNVFFQEKVKNRNIFLKRVSEYLFNIFLTTNKKFHFINEPISM